MYDELVKSKANQEPENSTDELGSALGNRLNSFRKSGRRKAIKVTPNQSVTMKLLQDSSLLPMLVEPAHEYTNIFEWLKKNREQWYSAFLKNGALLFRGFNIDSIEKMEAFSDATIDVIYKDNAEHKPVNANGSVQIPVDYAEDQHLLWHNENTFNLTWPKKAIFACAQPAAEGGETPIVDGRLIYQELEPKLRQKFIDKGVMYVRNYETDDYIGLSWKKIFNTDSRDIVEQICLKKNIEFEWKSGDRLVTRSIRPAVLKHFETGELCWINQAQHWHFSCLSKQTQDAISKIYKEEDYPRNCYFGDGSRIQDFEMQQVLDLYRENEVVFQWQKGDAILVDNQSTAHARNPYKGQRKILVCFGDMASF
jgi:alpha-ketoglutarate-dependent taurine dioxygenase